MFRWSVWDERGAACLQNRRYAAIARGRGASCPCIPSRGSEILSLRGWTFLLRVKRVSLLMTSWMLLVCKLEVCDRRARAGSVAPLQPLRSGEVLLLCCWEFLLRVKRVSLLMTSWMLLVCKLEVCDRRARAGSVAPLHPLKGWRGSFAARLGVSIEGRACWFAYDELDVARLRNRRCATIA